MALKRIKWILFLGVIVCTQLTIGVAQILNTPPILYVDRNWKISEQEPVDSLITRVKANDAENDILTFGLEPINSLYKTDDDEKVVLPFRINPDTGFVYLNESLNGRGGEKFFIYVTVTDGTVTAKNEVYVNILGKNSSDQVSSVYNNLPESFSPSSQNISKLLPPFHLLPGVQQTNTKVPVHTSGYHPNQPNTYVVRPNTHESINTPSSVDGHENSDPSSSITSSTSVDPNNSNGYSSTMLRPIVHGRPNGTTENKTDGIQPANTTNGLNYRTIIFITIVVFLLFVLAGAIIIMIFKKHLCAIGKSLKKKSKKEITKKSTQDTFTSSTTTVTDMDDSRNSTVLQLRNTSSIFGSKFMNSRSEYSDTEMSSQLSTKSFSSIPRVNSDKWEFPRHRLKFFNILGEGAFGQVWRCEGTDIDGNKGLTTVAVKTLKENATEIEKNDLKSELQVMKSLEPHVNVVRLLGCCTEKDPYLVIIEYVNRGKLQTFLRSSRAEKHYGNTHGKSNILTSSDLTAFMFQVARGMDFLSSRGIIHRDLAARNILITDDHTCKIADFGFARDIVTSKVYERKSEGKLPIRWMAIESLYDNIFTVKSDIWSFGILMWEIVTLGSTPYPGTAAAEVMKKVRDGYRLEKPEHCRRELYNIMYYCWADDPNERPTFTELVHLLDKLLLTETEYIELERFPDHNYYNMTNISGEKL